MSQRKSYEYLLKENQLNIDQLITYIDGLVSQVPIHATWKDANLVTYCYTQDSLIVTLTNTSMQNDWVQRPAIAIFDGETLRLNKFIYFSELVQIEGKSKDLAENLAEALNSDIKQLVVNPSGKIEIIFNTASETQHYRSINTIFEPKRRFAYAAGQKKYFEDVSQPLRENRIFIRLPYYFAEYVLRDTLRVNSEKIPLMELWLSTGLVNDLLFTFPLHKNLYPLDFPANGVYTRSGLYIYPHRRNFITLEIVPSEKSTFHSILSYRTFEILEDEMELRINLYQIAHQQPELISSLSFKDLIYPMVTFSPSTNTAIIFGFKPRSFSAVHDKIEQRSIELQLQGNEDLYLFSSPFSGNLREEILQEAAFRQYSQKYQLQNVSPVPLFTNESQLDLELFEFFGLVVDLRTKKTHPLSETTLLRFMATTRRTHKVISEWPMAWFNSIPNTLFLPMVSTKKDPTALRVACGALKFDSDEFIEYILLKALPAAQTWMARNDIWVFCAGKNDSGFIFNLKNLLTQLTS